MASSGMGKAEILSLRIQDFVDSLDRYIKLKLTDFKEINRIIKDYENATED